MKDEKVDQILEIALSPSTEQEVSAMVKTPCKITLQLNGAELAAVYCLVKDSMVELMGQCEFLALAVLVPLLGRLEAIRVRLAQKEGGSND